MEDRERDRGMSEELIKKSDAIDAINVYDDTAYALQDVQRITDGIAKVINAIPSIEPKRGEWIDNGDRYFRCSLCGTKDTDKWHWCHGCGADMRGKDDDSNNI